MVLGAFLFGIIFVVVAVVVDHIAVMLIVLLVTICKSSRTFPYTADFSSVSTT